MRNTADRLSTILPSSYGTVCTAAQADRLVRPQAVFLRQLLIANSLYRDKQGPLAIHSRISG